MIIKGSIRKNARALASHLKNSLDNEHIEVAELRGLAGQSLHACLLEMEAISQATRCQKPLFSVSFNPPQNVECTNEQFFDAFDRLEKKFGLENQPRAVVFHEKEGRRHAHVVWSRIGVETVLAIDLGLYKNKCTDLSRQLYLDHGWEMPRGLLDRQQRDPVQLTTAEWMQVKRKGIDPREIKALIKDAWQHSDGINALRKSLEEKNLFLAKGDKRGFVVIDYLHNIYSLPRYVGLKKREVETMIGSPDQLVSIHEAKQRILHTFNNDLLCHIDTLKKQQELEKLPFEEKKALLTFMQRAERKELSDQQRVKRSLVAKAGQDRFRSGVVRIFDKVIGRERTIRRINKKEANKLRRNQKKSKQYMILRQNDERRELQKEINALRDKHTQERENLAARIYDIRQTQKLEHKHSMSKEFERERRLYKNLGLTVSGASIKRARPIRTRGMSPE